MRFLKHLGTYLLLVIVLVLVLTVCAHELVNDCGLRALGKPGITEFFALSEADGTVAALGRQNEKLVLAKGDIKSGKRLSFDRLPKDWDELLISQMLLLNDDTVLLAGYRQPQDNSPAVFELWAWDGRNVTLVFNLKCRGNTAAEQLQSVTCSAIAQPDEDGQVRFAVWADGLCQIYHYDASDRSLLLTGSAAAAPVPGMQVDEEDMLAAAPVPDWEQGLSLWREDPILTARVDDTTWLYLLDHGQLFEQNALGQTELTDCIQRTRTQGILILIALGVGVLLLALIIWYLFSYSRKMTLSLLVRDGFWLLVFFAFTLGCMTQYLVIPSGEEKARSYAEQTLQTLAALAPENPDSESFSDLVSGALQANPDFSLLQAAFYQPENGDYIQKTASSAFLLSEDGLPGAFLQQLLIQAQEQGGVFSEQSLRGRRWYIYAAQTSNGLVVLRLGAWELLEQTGREASTICSGLWCLGALLYLGVFFELGRIRRSLRRVISGMDYLSQGHRQIRVQQTSGDELEALAGSFNGVAEYVDRVIQGENRLDNAYLRFMPHRIFHLLGAESVTQVDKNSFAVKQLTTMMVSIRFPEEVYNTGKRDLFDNINEVLERTAIIVSKNGGTIFNITYESFDAVFEDDPRQTVSTAVAIRQEILAMNRERETHMKPVATVHIALDLGNVMLGVVGDETRMVPVAVSESLTAARRMITLCDKLDASILCTQGMIDSAGEYRSRYVGKSRVGDDLLRIYEIFDGDSYSMIADKDACQSQFSEGIFAMYAGDCAKAKRIFMDIARQYFRDGAARYYLYLADRAEQETLQEISLDD